MMRNLGLVSGRLFGSALLMGSLFLMTALMQAQEQGMPPGLEIPSKMKPYFVGFLVENDKAPKLTEAENGKILKEHLASIRSNIEAGKYVFAGPFTDNGKIAGILVVNAASKEEAEQMLAKDPMVESGRVKVELHAAMLPDLAALKVMYPAKQLAK